MRFLADESCDFAIVRAIRSAGHDVLAVADGHASAVNERVLRMAARQKRLLLTEDKDFGQWVFAAGRATAGVILFRYPPSMRRTIAMFAVEVVARYGDRLRGAFTVIEPGRVRIRRIR